MTGTSVFYFINQPHNIYRTFIEASFAYLTLIIYSTNVDLSGKMAFSPFTLPGCAY